MPFNIAAYGSHIFSKTDNGVLPAETYDITVTGTVVTSGMNIDVTVRNLTSDNQPALKWRIDCGWGTSGVAVAPTGLFLADVSWKNRPMGSQYVNSLRNAFWGTSFFSTGVDAAAGINIPAMCIHAGSRAIGIANNYPYAHVICPVIISGSIYGIESFGDNTYTADHGTERINDFYSSGETRSWNIWLRECSGYTVTTGVSLSMIQPYTDWFMSAWPDQRPPVLSGRIHGQFFGQTETSGNPRGYNIISGVYPSSGNVDWNTVLNTFFPSPAAMAAKGENGVMIWCLPGKKPTYEFPMNIAQSTPENLASRFYQVKDWSNSNGVKVYVYLGAAYLYYQPSGNWDDPFLRMENDTATVTGYVLASATRHAFNPTGASISRLNIDNGALVWFDGAGFDAMPDVVLRPYMTGILQTLRNERPGKFLLAEAFKTPQTQSYLPCTYYPSYRWDGLRCPWLDTVFPGYQNWAILNSSEFANTGVYNAEIARCEAAGLGIITLTSPTTFNAISGVSYTAVNIVDKKSQAGRPRGVR